MRPKADVRQRPWIYDFTSWGRCDNRRPRRSERDHAQQALRATAERFGGRDRRMLAARVEPKNGPKGNKEIGNFKPLVLSQFQAAVDTCFEVLTLNIMSSSHGV